MPPLRLGGTLTPVLILGNDDLFDLSPYYDLMEAVLPGWSTSIGWPGQPDTSGGTVEVDSNAELSAAVALSNRQVNIGPGLSLSGNFNITGNHLEVFCPTSTTIAGNIGMTSGRHHFWWHGGNIITPTANAALRFDSVEDMVLDDLYVEGGLTLHRDVTGCKRVLVMNSTLDSRNNTASESGTGTPHPVFVFQGAAPYHEDFIFANNRLIGGPVGGEYACRFQNVQRTIVVESAHNVGTGVGERGFRFTLENEYAVVAGRADKKFIMLGNIFASLIDAGEAFGIQESRWDHIQMYHSDEGLAEQAGGPANTGEISNFELFSSGSGVGSPPTGYSPFTLGENVANVQDWDGTTLPDDSDYGAQR